MNWSAMPFDLASKLFGLRTVKWPVWWRMRISYFSNVAVAHSKISSHHQSSVDCWFKYASRFLHSFLTKKLSTIISGCCRRNVAAWRLNDEISAVTFRSASWSKIAWRAQLQGLVIARRWSGLCGRNATDSSARIIQTSTVWDVVSKIFPYEGAKRRRNILLTRAVQLDQTGVERMILLGDLWPSILTKDVHMSSLTQTLRQRGVAQRRNHWQTVVIQMRGERRVGQHRHQRQIVVGHTGGDCKMPSF